ncbi:MAG: plasmid pRiA4b ORF-3 family protein [Dehalococcoidia bacterium]|nr:plasmid pRiA4b ORF-3 family protein [Dehalococcoidia bacterium]
MEKSLVLSVTVGTGCYRHIQISEDATLSDLSSAILDAFEFFDDHLHAFFMNNRAWDETEQYVCSEDDSDYARGFTDKVKLSKFSLRKGNKFLYIFDYGDDWQFQIRVLRVISEPTKTPLVLKSVGEVSQYDYDEDNEDEDF